MADQTTRLELTQRQSIACLGCLDFNSLVVQRQALAKGDQTLKELIVVEINGENRIDSRVMAARLDYDHETVVRSIKRHQERLEAKSVLRHFVGKPKGPKGGRPETYYMLDERQCLILAGSLKKGAEADEWHDKLVDAFLTARKRVEELENQQSSKPRHQFNFKYQERLALNKNVRIYGYIPVTKFLDDINIQFLEDVVILSETSSPDISIGKFLAKRLPSETWYNAKIVRKPVGGNDRREWDQDIVMTVYVKDGYPVKREVTFYPIEWYAPIWHIVQTEYFPDLFPKYLEGKHKGTMRCESEATRKYITERVNYFLDRQ
jgi:phage regulator Rha-like protein